MLWPDAKKQARLLPPLVVAETHNAALSPCSGGNAASFGQRSANPPPGPLPGREGESPPSPSQGEGWGGGWHGRDELDIRYLTKSRN